MFPNLNLSLITFISILCFLNINIYGINGDMYTSLTDIISLVKTEAEVTKFLKKFVDIQSEKISEAKLILKDFETIAEQSKDNPEAFIGNPVNSFLIIKKLSKDLQNFFDMVNMFEKLRIGFNEINETNPLPTIEDYKGAITAIHRLEDTYLLDPKDIKNGNLSQNYFSRPLTAFECFEIGRIAYEKGDYYHSIRWLSLAWEESLFENNHSTVSKIDILDFLSYAHAQQGNIKQALELTKVLLTLDPKHVKGIENLRIYKKNLTENNENWIEDVNVNDTHKIIMDPFQFKNPRPISQLTVERKSYELLCREQPKLPENRLKNLKCRYINYSPLLLIAPVKEELIFDDPPIWLYHDVITDEQINMMKKLGQPKLKRAFIKSPITNRDEKAEYRISKSGWLSDQEHPKLPYLSKLVSSITNLSMISADRWQIANYGIGGQYEPHFDFVKKNEPRNAFKKSMGNRIATWLFYLEAPESGGATVFPRIGLRIPPKRRAAAFWYNLLPSGDGDFNTRHAACPVLFGTKWVSNKWIHAVGQELIRPCNLHREHTEDN